MSTTVKDIQLRAEALAKKREELKKSIAELEGRVADLKGKAQTAAEAGRVDEYKAANSAAQDAEASLYVARVQLQKTDFNIPEKDIKAAWADYAAAYNKKLEKMSSALESKRKELLADYKAMVDLQAEAFEARELLARLAGLNLREGAAFDRAFPCKTLEGWIGALWDMSERGTGFNSPDALYYALQIAKRAGKHIIRLYDEPEFMRFQDVVSNHISKR